MPGFRCGTPLFHLEVMFVLGFYLDFGTPAERLPQAPTS